jgi:hypothetical protein
MKARKMTPKDFVPHLMTVLADLTKRQAGVSVPMQETYDPVCARMNLQATDFGKSEHGTEGNKTPWVHRQIGLAFRQMRDNGLGEYAKRGHWALTEAGVEQLDDKAQAPSEATLAAAKAQARAEDDDESNVVHFADPIEEHPYSDDPYIRGLAVERTPCFGAYSVRSDVCKGCLLRDDCVAAVAIRKAEIAADLEREELVARRAAESAKKKKDQQSASIDELMRAMDKGDDQKSFGKNGKFEPLAGQIVSTAFAQRESLCGQCSEEIPEGDECFWVEGEGVFHPDCINAPKGA